MRNLWSKASITRKVFFSLSLAFFLYGLFNFLGHTVFYGKIYTYYQKQSMIKNISAFGEEYSRLTDFDDINSAIVDFSNENGSYIMITSSAGDVLHSLSYYMTVSDSGGNMYRFSLDGAVSGKEFGKLGLDVGDRITVYYSGMREPEYRSFYNPQKIIKGTALWEMPENRNRPGIPPDGGNPGETGNIPDRNNSEAAPTRRSAPPIPYEDGYTGIYGFGFNFRQYSQVSGIITKIEIPTDFDVRKSIKRNESVTAITRVISDNAKNNVVLNKDRDYIYINDNNGERYMVLARKTEHEGEEQFIFTVNTLHSMDEAIDIMRYSYRLWFFAALIVVISVSVILSGVITKPVKNISAVTSKMKNLDFSQKCDINSEDELGQLARNINDMSDRLDDTIRELTEANAKLKSDMEKEREIENRRKEFVAAVSHELKTPLAIIRAYSEGLEDGISVEKRSRYISVIIEETKKMSSLVNDMLQNSRLESKAAVMDIKRHDLSEFTERVADRLLKNAKEKGINILKDIDRDIYADFDKYYLEQVIGNFITNAIRHTPAGMEMIVSVKKEDNFCEVSVENEGSHIEEQSMDKIWDRFYKADKSRSGEGTGLGLSIAKNILDLHNASYYAENTEKGVRFCFRLSEGAADGGDNERADGEA
ncbi:MAG: HAMP domain-containing protein [Oscillospiraceae bacterium]|nr:HAMP domain-containing protein [Oscillospiraceae bacterium]